MVSATRFRTGRTDLHLKSCDFCAFYAYDEDFEDYYCTVNLDEDDMYRLMTRNYKECPYFRNGDEYAVVRHQI